MGKPSKPFAAVKDEERRTLRIPVLVNAHEKRQIEEAAQIRSLDTSEWVRRAALGRKADIRYDTQIVLSIAQLVQTIRTVNETFQTLEQIQDDPALKELLIIMRDTVAQAKAALLRIEK